LESTIQGYQPFFPPAVPSIICFILLAAMMVKAGAAIDRGPTGFGKTESVHWKLANKAVIYI